MTISEESKMSVECFFGFELGLVRTFVAIFEFAMISLHRFFGIANAMFVLLSDLFLHSLIVASSSDWMVLVRTMVYCWFLKPPRKPPDDLDDGVDLISHDVRSLADCCV